MKPISEVTACVVDHGLFTHVAQCMAAQCKHVFFVGPPERVMRRLEDDIVGDGLDNITRIESPYDVEDIADVFVFPDVGFAADQRKLIKDGRAVWGHHGGAVLETNKGYFLHVLEELGMEVPPHEVCVGMDELSDYLHQKEDVYIKLSKWREGWETAHWRNEELDGDWLRGHKFNRCPVRNHLRFYVFDKIDSDVEDGIDTWCINGEWPKLVLHGMERKDCGFLGGIQPMSAIDETIRSVNETFGPFLETKFGYRGAFSTEVRPPFFIDPTCRFPSPPSQLQTVLIKNLPDVIYRGAHGIMVEPEYDDPLGAQVLITSDRDKAEYLTFPLDAEIEPWVKMSFACEVDGVKRIAPNAMPNWAGWLTATGPTIQAVVETLKERKAMLPEGFECDLNPMAKLLTELEDAAEQGIEITDQEIPPQEIVLEGDKA